MSDIFSSQKRSQIMSKVRTKETDIEKILGRIVKDFWENNRYYKNVKKLPGSPDVVFLKKKIAIFADGDFWHGKNFEEWKEDVPKFWKNKIGKNMKRDKRQTEELRNMGYSTLRFWGSELKRNPSKVKKEIERKLELNIS